MTTMNLTPRAVSPPRGRITLILLAGILLLACLAYVVVHAMRASRRAATHAPIPVTPAASALSAAPIHTSAVSHATPAPTPSSENLADQLAAEAAAFRAHIAALTGRLDRMSGTDAALLLQTTPELPARIELAARVSSTCRNYAAGAWFLSNVYCHALASGSVTDVFRAGWYWGDFCAAHHAYDDAIALYESLLARLDGHDGLSPNSFVLLLNNLTLTLGMAQYAEREEAAARRLHDYLWKHHADLTADACAFGFATYATRLYNTHEFDEARAFIAMLRNRMPHLFDATHSPLRMVEDALRGACDKDAHISVTLGDLRPAAQP